MKNFSPPQAALILVLCFLVFEVVSLRLGSPYPQSIRVENVVIVGEDGEPRGFLNASGLTLFDENDNPRFALRADDSFTVIDLCDENGASRVNIAAKAESLSALSISDHTGEQRILIGCNGGRVRSSLFNQDGEAVYEAVPFEGEASGPQEDASTD